MKMVKNAFAHCMGGGARSRVTSANVAVQIFRAEKDRLLLNV